MSAVGHSRHFRPVRRTSAYPLTAAREQTFREGRLGRFPDSRIAAICVLFDHLVGMADQLNRNAETKGFRGLKVKLPERTCSVAQLEDPEL